jgi:hypothetical protein
MARLFVKNVFFRKIASPEELHIFVVRHTLKQKNKK